MLCSRKVGGLGKWGVDTFLFFIFLYCEEISSKFNYPATSWIVDRVRPLRRRVHRAAEGRSGGPPEGPQGAEEVLLRHDGKDTKLFAAAIERSEVMTAAEEEVSGTRYTETLPML